MTIHIRLHRPTETSTGSVPRWATWGDHMAFVAALEANDGDRLLQLAEILMGSLLVLPDDACLNIGVPLGSTYARGIRVLFPDIS